MGAPTSASARFFAKVRKTDGCWFWTASTHRARLPNAAPYGQFNDGHTTVKAHRFSWELHHGRPIPAGLTIDDLCRNTLCVRPDHLEAVTLRTNTLRGTSMVAKNAKLTHCRHGHAFTPENTYYVHRGNRPVTRQCRTCVRAAGSRYYRNKKAAVSR